MSVASEIGAFLVKIGYTLDKKSERQAEKSLEKVGDKAEDTAKQAEKVAKTSLEKVAEAIAGLNDKVSSLRDTMFVVGASWAGSKVLEYVNSTAEQFDALYNAANRVGSTAENLGGLQYALAQSGVEAEALESSLDGFSDIIGQAKLGEGEGLEVFQKLGIQLKDANGNARDTVAIFNDLQGAMAGLDKQTQVAYLGMLGMDGQLAQSMSVTAEEFQSLQAEYASAYGTLGVNVNDAAEQAHLFKNTLNQLKQTFSVITDAVGVSFFQESVQAFQDLRRVLTENISKIALVLKSLMSMLMAIAKSFVALGKTALEVVSSIIDWYTRQSTLFRTIIKIIGGVTAAILVMNTAFMKSPIGRLLALITAVGMLIEDFQVWKQGGDSLIGSLLGGFEQVRNAAGWFAPVIENLDKVALGLAAIPVAIKGWGIIGPLLKGIIGPFATLVKLIPLLTGGIVKLGIAFMTTPIGWLIAAIGALIAAGVLLYQNWDVVKEKLGAAWDWIVSKVQAAGEFIRNICSSIVEAFLAIPDLVSTAWANFTSYIMQKLKALVGPVTWLLEKLGIIEESEAPDLSASEEEAPNEPEPSAYLGNNRADTERRDTVFNRPDVDNSVTDGLGGNASVQGGAQDALALPELPKFPEFPQFAPLKAPEQASLEQAAPVAPLPSVPFAAPLRQEENAPATNLTKFADLMRTPVLPEPVVTVLENQSQPAPAPVVDVEAPAVSVMEPERVQPVLNLPDLSAPSANLAALGEELNQRLQAPPLASEQSITNNSNMSVTQTNGDTNITILAAPEPQRTAELVAAKQSSVQDTQLRNLRRGIY